MSPLSARVVAVVGVAVLLASCSDPIGPSDISGTYVLTRAGSEIPPLLITFDDGSIWRIDADTVVLRADGTGTRRTVDLFTPTEGEGRQGESEINFTYRVRGRTVRATVDRGADAVLQTFELDIIGDGLWRDPFRYQRRGAPAP